MQQKTQAMTIKHKQKSAPSKIESTIEYKKLYQNGYDIYYYMSGKPNAELIVFLHAAFIDHHCFDNQIDFFSEKYRVITIDMLGHGLSEVLETKDTIDKSAKHIRKILDLENYQQAHLVGVSMGSLIAQHFANKYPEKTLSLSILGGYNIQADNSVILKAQRNEQLKWVIIALFSMNAFRKYVAKKSVNEPEQQVLFYEMAKHFSLKSFRAMSGLSKIFATKKHEQQSKFPLLLLCGEYDLKIAIDAAQKWAEQDTGIQLSIIEKAGHCANMDKPETFNAVLLDFIKEKKELSIW